MQDEKQKKSFKTRVLETIIECASTYNDYYVEYDYLILSDAFKKKPYYIISADKDNYLHLTGVSTALSARAFFDKCIDGTLIEDDFDLMTHGKSEKESRGTIRQKVKNLPHITSVISATSQIQEDFRRNAVVCTFASAISSATLGFISAANRARPKSLLNGSVIDPEKSSSIKLALSRQRNSEKFDTLLIGNMETLIENSCTIRELLSEKLLADIDSFYDKQKSAPLAESAPDADAPSSEDQATSSAIQ